MKKYIISGIAFILILGFSSSCKKKNTEWKDVSIESKQDSVSYAIGMDIANQFKNQGIEVDYPSLVQGMKDYMEDNALMDKEEQMRVLSVFQQDLQNKHQQEMEAKATENKEKAKEFFEENAKKEGIQTTESGLQYQILEPGSGEKPRAFDTVTVHYKGMLLDGTIFDSSYDRGEPATFPLNRVIKGWTEGLQLIGKGGKIKLFIPPELGYGDMGAGQTIPPGSALIFEVELIDIKPGSPDAGGNPHGF